MIHVFPKNQSFVHVECNDIDAIDIAEAFSVQIPGYEHTPTFKKSKGKWDGSVKMFSTAKRELYFGHLGRLGMFAAKNKIPIKLEPGILHRSNYDEAYIDALLDEAKLPSHFERRPYQYQAALEAINTRRMTVESPTASGKSFLCYILILHLLKIGHEGQIALIALRS